MSKSKKTRHVSPPADIGALAQECHFRRRAKIYQKVAALIVRGHTITAALKAAGVSESGLRRWRNRVSVGGLAALDFPAGRPRWRAAKRPQTAAPQLKRNPSRMAQERGQASRGSKGTAVARQGAP